MNSSRPDISICIVNWNTGHKLIECLRSVYAFSEQLCLEVIIVDNASTDGSACAAQQQFPQIRLIRNNENTGFATANNQALKSCHGTYILLLNPDTVLVEPCFKTMMRLLDTLPDAGMLGCKLRHRDGTVQKSFFNHFPSPLRELWANISIPLARPQRNAPPTDTLKAAWIVGAFMFMKKEVLVRVHGFDERFFLYSEDVDLCYRLHKTGLAPYYCATITALHVHHASSDQHPPHFAAVQQRASRYTYMHKHYGFLHACLFRVGVCVGCLVRISVLAPAVLLLPRGHAHKLGETMVRQVQVFRWTIAAKQVARTGPGCAPTATG